jgi:exosortase
LFASRIATLAIQTFGIPVLREGNVITLTTTTLEVAEACSGLRSLISLISLGVVFAYFTKKIFWQRVALVALCIPIAIFVNSLRVTITGIMASYYGESVAKGFYHDFSGYLLFIVALLLLFCVSGIFTFFSRKRVGLK